MDAGVQDLVYNAPTVDKIGLVIFDVFDLKARRFYNWHELEKFSSMTGLRLPPVLFVGKWKDCSISYCTDGNSMLNSTHIREGFVVKPAVERYHNKLGRVILKSISEKYRLRQNGTEFK